MKRKKSGFCIKLNGVKYHVYFKNFNDRAVVCYIAEGDEFGQALYHGRAVCHPDDNFDFEYGKQIAFARALERIEKIFKKSEDIYQEAFTKAVKTREYIINSIQKKFDKKVNSGLI